MNFVVQTYLVSLASSSNKIAKNEFLINGINFVDIPLDLIDYLPVDDDDVNNCKIIMQIYVNKI